MDTGALLRKLLFLPDAGTEFADSIDHLHFLVISVTMLGSAAVFVAAAWFMIRYRRKGEPTLTPWVQASKRVESLFIGGLLTFFIICWVIGFAQYIRYATPPRDTEDIYVTGKQWMWKFAYPSGRGSVGVLVVPANRNVRLVLTSRDVIHSFYVPEFRVKRDAVPGRYTTAWFKARDEGIYQVFCAEYCGTSHSQMWAKVVVLSGEDYDRWMGGEEPRLVAEATARPPFDDPDIVRVGGTTRTMAEEGRLAASRYGCLSCHTVDGQSHIGPTWHGLFGRVVHLEGGRTVTADEEYLTESMMNPPADVVLGFKPVMPTYLGTLKQPDAAAIVEFIKSLTTEPPDPSVLLPETEASDRTGPLPPDGTSPGFGYAVEAPTRRGEVGANTTPAAPPDRAPAVGIEPRSTREDSSNPDHPSKGGHER